MQRSYSDSSFKITSTTSPPQPTTLKDITIGGRSFPYFPLPINASGINATYTFDIHSKTAPHDTFAFYAPAIIYAGGAPRSINDSFPNPANIEPHYTFPPPNSVPPKIHDDYPWGNGHSVTFHTSYYPLPAADTPFPSSGTIGFSISTTQFDKSIFAITFEIPVYAVYKTPESVEWYLRPGYGGYSHELDNGNFENGGAILIGVGNIEGGLTSGLIIVGNPIKYIVPNTNFTLQGIEIYFREGSSLTNLTPISSPNYPNYLGWSNLTFYYDSDNDQNADTEMTSSVTPLPPGKIKIGVVYVVGGVTYRETFYVMVNAVDDILIPYQNRYIIAKSNDWVTALNGMTSGNYLFVFSENVNISHTLNIGANVSIYLVATKPGLIIGRTGGNGQTVFNSGVSNGTMIVNIYLGEWPFNEPAFAGGDVITDYPFSINAKGTWQTFPSGINATVTDDDYYMFKSGENFATGGNVIVNILGGMQANISYPPTQMAENTHIN